MGSAACTEADGKVQLHIKRTDGCSGDVTLEVSTEDVTAVAGSDFKALDREPVVFKNGETEKIVEVEVFEDDTFEKNETFNVVFELPGSPDNGTKFGMHKQCIVTIVGDEDMKEIANEVAELMAQVAENMDLKQGIFGCLVGLSDGITAITFVALGTSLPDTFASKTAAVQYKTADASVGNVTG